MEDTFLLGCQAVQKSLTQNKEALWSFETVTRRNVPEDLYVQKLYSIIIRELGVLCICIVYDNISLGGGDM
jgi:hypothetical protein